MEKDVYAIDGQKKDSISLSSKVFGIETSLGSVYHAVRNELANRRVGTACTKTRSEINARHQKPYRQKGTGRARAGRTSSPIWVGGGVAFGPRPRDYSYNMPRKIKRLAIKSVLSLKTVNNAVSVVEDFTIESGKTRDFLAILGTIFLNNTKGKVRKEKIVVIMGSEDIKLRRASSNLPNVNLLVYNRLSVHKLFYADKLLVLQTAAVELGEFYGS